MYARQGEVWKKNREAERQEFLLQEAGSNLVAANAAMKQNQASINSGFAKAAGGFLERAGNVQGMSTLSERDKGYYQLGGIGQKFGFWLQQFMGSTPSGLTWGTDAERKELEEMFPDTYKDE